MIAQFALTTLLLAVLLDEFRSRKERVEAGI